MMVLHGFATSFLELAYHAWEVGVRLENVQPHPSVYSTLIRKAINFCNRRFPDVPVHPGIIKTTCLGNGKTHPSTLLVPNLICPLVQESPWHLLSSRVAISI